MKLSKHQYLGCCECLLPSYLSCFLSLKVHVVQDHVERQVFFEFSRCLNL